MAFRKVRFLQFLLDVVEIRSNVEALIVKIKESFSLLVQLMLTASLVLCSGLYHLKNLQTKGFLCSLLKVAGSGELSQ